MTNLQEMVSASGLSGEQTARVLRVLEGYLAALEGGAPPHRDELLARHPDLADLLAEYLDKLDQLHEAAAGLRAAPPHDEPGALATGGSRLGDFEILREVGRGGMGIVYEAEQISLGRRVALKVLPFAATLDPRHLQRFHNEARAAAGLHHTNIVPVYAVGQERSVHFYAMQFIDGQSLAGLLEHQRIGPANSDQPTTGNATAPPQADTSVDAAVKTAPAPRDKAYFRCIAEWGIQAAEALDYAHQMGIVHRDIKPANLLVDASGRAWVTDFGLAQVQSDVRLTMTGDLVGTLRYMSPEQALAKRVVIDHRTDIYSLGATLYEVLTLRPAFDGKDRQELLRQIAFEEPRRLRSIYRAIPPELETIVLKAMEHHLADRYATAQELADDLRRWLEDRPIVARRPSLVQRARKWSRRHRPVVWAMAVVALLAAAAGLWYQQDRAEQRAETARRQAEERRGAEQALAEAKRLQQQARWPQAQAILAQALSQLGEAAPAELRESLEQAQRELGWVVLLDSIRLRWPDVLMQADSINNRRYFEKAEADYAAAFREIGVLSHEAEAVTTTAARVQASSIRPALVAALDDWAGITRDRKRRARLLTVARLADPDPVRDRVRDPKVWNDANSLDKIADEVDVAALGPQLLVALGRRLDQTKIADPVPLLKAGQARYPSDFWLNDDLAGFLLEKKKPEEAIGYCRAALALRPDSAGVHNHLGAAFAQQGKLDDAFAEFTKAVDIDPNYAMGHYNRGNIWLKKREWEKAVAATQKAIDLEPDFPEAFFQLGVALRDQENRGAAFSAWKKAAELKPDYAIAHWYLGHNLRNQGRYAESLAELKRAQELGLPQLDWPNSPAQEVRLAESYVALDAKLQAILRGESPPLNPGECLMLARICKQAKSLNAAAVRFWASAFAARPQLEDDLRAGHRYNAACAAALAGCGRGNDAGQINEKERARFRQQALEWLRADLAAHRRLLEKEPDKSRPADGGSEKQRSTGDKSWALMSVSERLRFWQQDRDFVGVRGPEALAQLPEAEGQAWQKLWADVAVVLAQAEGKTAPEKKSATK